MNPLARDLVRTRGRHDDDVIALDPDGRRRRPKDPPWRSVFALAATAAAAGSPALGESPAGVPELRVEGNWVLEDGVYGAVVDLPPDAVADEATAERVRLKVLWFLHRAGYDLATVQARTDGNAIELRVNEGRLEKVVFRGRLTVQTLRFKLALNLPHDVFNRPSLDRQMLELSEAFGTGRASYVLVPTERVQHAGPQLENLGTFRGVALVRPLLPYELHVSFEEKEWDTGVGLDIRSSYPDGLELGANYQGGDLLFPRDRWRVAASAGAWLRERIAGKRFYLALSRVFGEARWVAPPIPGPSTRPFVWAQAELLARQRADLELENVDVANLEGSLHLQQKLGDGVEVSLGGGVQYRSVFDFATTGLKPPPPTEIRSARLRSFGLVRAELTFDDERSDRRHLLTAEARQYFAIEDPLLGQARLRYQRVFALGWHDLRLQANGMFSWSEVLFHYEEPVGGRYLRGVLGGEYVRWVGSASAEFRFSVTRDLYKLSVFHDLAVFGHLDRTGGAETLGTPTVANSFGPGFHALIEGMLQLDLYVAFGFASDGRFESGVHGILQKVF